MTQSSRADKEFDYQDFVCQPIASPDQQRRETSIRAGGIPSATPTLLAERFRAPLRLCARTSPLPSKKN